MILLLSGLQNGPIVMAYGLAPSCSAPEPLLALKLLALAMLKSKISSGLELAGLYDLRHLRYKNPGVSLPKPCGELCTRQFQASLYPHDPWDQPCSSTACTIKSESRSLNYRKHHAQDSPTQVSSI